MSEFDLHRLAAYDMHRHVACDKHKRISIVLVSALRRPRESEQISGLAIVKHVQLDAHEGWKLVQRRQKQRRERSGISFFYMLRQPPGHWLQFEPLALLNGPYLSV